jgi:hypothetical protein
MSAEILPFEPLEAAVQQTFAEQVGHLPVVSFHRFGIRPVPNYGVDGRNEGDWGIKGLLTTAERQRWYRARRTGSIGVYEADRFCVKVLHVHPVQVWGEQWWCGECEEGSAGHGEAA